MKVFEYKRIIKIIILIIISYKNYKNYNSYDSYNKYFIRRCLQAFDSENSYIFFMCFIFNINIEY